MDGHGHAALVLDEEVGECGVGVSGDLGHHVEPGNRPRVHLHLAVDETFEAVEARVDHAVDRERVDEERHRPTADHRHPLEVRHELLERVACGGERTRDRRVVDDRCEGAVEVDEERGARGLVDERLQRRGDVGHAGRRRGH